MAAKTGRLQAFREAVGYDVNPYCVKHRKRMQVRGPRGRGGAYKFQCLVCFDEGAATRKRRRVRKRATRPHCVTCRVAMNERSNFDNGGPATKQFLCAQCGVTTLNVIVARFGDRPNCIRCKIEMTAINWQAAKKKGGGWTHVCGWKCRRCRQSCRASSMDKMDGRTRRQILQESRARLLIASVEAKLPPGILPEIREEMRSAIIVDIKANRLRLSRLDGKKVQEYRRAAQLSPFSHISLEHFIGDGLRLGDVLEG
jgi:hypothetical protein